MEHDLVVVTAKMEKLKARVKGLEELADQITHLERTAYLNDGLNVKDNAALSAAYEMFERRLTVVNHGL